MGKPYPAQTELSPRLKNIAGHQEIVSGNIRKSYPAQTDLIPYVQNITGLEKIRPQDISNSYPDIWSLKYFLPQLLLKGLAIIPPK
jgi:hypothetical protein